jgi:flagellar biosynthesis chaperone FliJ
MAEPFRLQRVLRLREQIRRLRTHEAEQIASRLAAVRAEIEHLATARERCGTFEGEAALTGTLTPESLRVGRAYEASERARALEAVQLGHALDAKRAQLLRDKQEEEKYVRLAAAHRARVLEDEAREAERTLDEIAADRHRRNRKDQGHDNV